MTASANLKGSEARMKDSLFGTPRHLAAAALVAAFCAATSCGRTDRHTPSSAESAAHRTLTFIRQLPGSPWSQYHVATPNRAIDVYLVRDEHPKPVVVMLQGSGCVPLFTVDADRTFHGTTIFEDMVLPRQSHFHFAVVEKQGVKALEFTPGMTRQQQLRVFKEVENGACSPAYFKDETEVVRAEDALAIVEALAAQPWVRQVVIVGHSEGSRVVTGVLRRDARHLIAAGSLFSSAGPTQFYGGFETRDSFQKTFETIQMLQRADDDFMYQGHAARRWKSYALDTTPLEDVRESVVPLYVAHGEREPNIHAADLFVLEALRQQPTRPLRYVVVRDGDHDSSDGRGHFAQVFDDFLAWALNPQRATGVKVLR